MRFCFALCMFTLYFTSEFDLFFMYDEKELRKKVTSPCIKISQIFENTWGKVLKLNIYQSEEMQSYLYRHLINYKDTLPVAVQHE